MKTLRKKTALLLVFCLLITLFAGCGKESVKEGQKRKSNTPTGVTETPAPTGTDVTPTVAPTATPDVTQAPTLAPTASPSKPWSTPAFDKPEYTEAQKAFDDFLNEIVREMAKGQGIALHFSLENPEKLGITFEKDLGEVETDYKEYADFCEKYKTRMAGFNYEELTPGQQVNYDRLMYEFGIGMQLRTLNMEAYCGYFSVNGNVIDNLGTLFSEYAFLSEQDILDYFEALKTFPKFAKDLTESARKYYLEKGCLLTEEMLDTTVNNIDGLVVQNGNPLVEAFAVNVKEAGLSEQQNAAYEKQYKELLDEYVFEPLFTMEKEIKNWYGKCPQETYGIAKMKGGKELYEYMMQTTLGTTKSGDEIFKYLEGKMDKQYQSLIKLATFHQNILSLYPYSGFTEEDPQKILNSLKDNYIKTNYPAIPDTKYTVSDLPEALRVSGVLAYFLTPQYDNSARKIIRFNPDGISDCSSFFSTLAHEGYPGHLYQHEYFTNCEGYHVLNSLLSYTGYLEGWAVIAGHQAYNYIIPDADLADFYRLNYNLDMTIASLVAIGVHYYGWTADDTSNYLKKYSYGAYGELFYDMVLSDPVVYLPYTIGQYLVEDTFAALIAKGYSDIEAKTAVLNIGPCSFEVLWSHLGLDL
ncbi:MAG: DUF885 family protein [Lachnospiraceae bacterium]|nr:DUF885 family protein [Lachnospiraceae bacterium]